MKNILFFLAIITLTACDNKGDNEDMNVYWGAGIDFSVFNADNEDLLDPENPKHLDESKIKLFYVINGKVEEIYRANLDNPRNFLIYKHENEYRIGVGLNDYDKSEITTTYIQWNEKDTDTIEASFYRTKSSTTNKKIWLNGKLIWQDADYAKGPYLKLVK